MHSIVLQIIKTKTTDLLINKLGKIFGLKYIKRLCIYFLKTKKIKKLYLNKGEIEPSELIKCIYRLRKENLIFVIILFIILVVS